MAATTLDALLGRLEKLAQNPKTRLEELLEYLEHEAPAVRQAAIGALWSRPGPKALEALVKRLKNDVEPAVRAAAVEGLGRYIWNGLQMDERLEGARSAVDGVTWDLVKEARDTLHALRTDLSQELTLRLRAVEALAWDPDQLAQQAIVELWEQAEKAVKLSALKSMGRSGLARYHNLILSALETKDKELLLAAIEAAGDACVEQAEKALLSYAEKPEGGPISLAAIWALRNVVHTSPARRALERLGRALDPEKKKMARAALEELDALDVEDRGNDEDDD